MRYIKNGARRQQFLTANATAPFIIIDNNLCKNIIYITTRYGGM